MRYSKVAQKWYDTTLYSCPNLHEWVVDIVRDNETGQWLRLFDDDTYCPDCEELGEEVDI